MAAITAVERVFAIPELLEMILLDVDEQCPPSESSHYEKPALLGGITQLFALQRVNTKFRDSIKRSKPLQVHMHVSRAIPSCPTSITDVSTTLQRAWTRAMESYTTAYEQSWRGIRMTRNSPCTIVERQFVPQEVLRGTYLEGRTRSYHATFEVSEETTLGMLFDWRLELEERAPKDHLEAWRRGHPKEEGFAMVIRTSAFSLLY